VDHVPLCFEGLCHGITRWVYETHPDLLGRADFYLQRGVDVAAGHSPPALSERHFSTRAWKEHPAGEPHPVMVKEYTTGAGVLRQRVRWTPDYDESPYGRVAHPGEVRLFSDHNVPPGRSEQYLVSGAADLAPLRALLQPIAGADRDAYLAEAKTVAAFCQRRGILHAGYSSGVGDPLIWMSGVEPLLMLAMDQPDILAQYVQIVADWNLQNLELMIEAGCEYIVRRGWYESADFWSPALFRQYLMEPLRREIATAHRAGVLYAYCMNSGLMPMLDVLAELDLDILCNIDPNPTGTDLRIVKQRLGQRMVLCGGINNNHILEQGTAEDVRRGVGEALDTLGPDKVMLAPADSILANTPTARRNFDALIEAWKERCC